MDAIAETPALEHLFSPMNAREMAARSWEARRKRKADNLQSLDKPATPPLEADYIAEQLARTRSHLDRIDERLATTRDPLDLDRLTRARSALVKDEWLYAGRPLPGKAGKEKPARTKAADLVPG